MARVRALQDCYIDQIRRQGEEFEYSGPKNENLEPVKKQKNGPEDDESDGQQKLPTA